MPRLSPNHTSRGFFGNWAHHGYATIVKYARPNSISASQKLRSENISRPPLGHHATVGKHDDLITVTGGEIEIVNGDQREAAPGGNFRTDELQ